MSENLGPMTFGKKEEQIFLGRDFTQTKDYSEQTAIEIDSEVRRILKDAYERAKRLLRANLEILHKMAAVLLEKEVLDGNEIDELLRTFGSSNGAAGEAQPAAS
jgi:cell division protease FtsH